MWTHRLQLRPHRQPGSYIFADILRRTLQYNGYEVPQVMNVTDVGHLTSDQDVGEDKIEVEAGNGKDIWEIARHFESVFFQDIEGLNIREPAWVKCRATEHIADMIALIEKLFSRGHAYKPIRRSTSTWRLFRHTHSFPRQSLDDKITAARDEVQEDPDKRSPADFALWFKANYRQVCKPRSGSDRRGEWAFPAGTSNARRCR